MKKLVVVTFEVDTEDYDDVEDTDDVRELVCGMLQGDDDPPENVSITCDGETTHHLIVLRH